MSLHIAATVDRGAWSLHADLRLQAAATGIFGPSGAGKTTLLHLVTGLVRPTVGRIALDGEVLCDTAAGIQVPVHRRRIGTVFQQGLLLPHLRVRGNLAYGERLVPPERRRLSFAQVVELLELGGLLERLPHQLSGGQRQRVALGRALLCSPRLLVLDEPLAALDRGLKRQIMPFLRRVRESAGIPVLHVSHDLAELLQVCDELVLVDRGRVVAQGTLDRVVRVPAALPLLHDLGLVNILRATVARHDADGLSVAALADGREVLCPRLDHPPGTAVDLLLRPEDVVIAGMAVPDLSLQNQLAARITAVTSAPERTLLHLDLGGGLLAEVTPRAARLQGLGPGQRVYALFKATAVQARS